MRVFVVVVVGWLIAVVCPGCSTNLATGKKHLNILSTSREIAVGNEAAPGFMKGYGGAIPSRQIRDYVSQMGQRLAAQSERPDLPWEFTVLNSQTVNAFALPGGKIFISRGLLGKLDNEAQLAGVLGHEIGHVTASHVGQQMTRNLLLQTAVVGMGLAGEHNDSEWLRVLGVGTQLGGTVYLLKFGRDQEIEADMLGLRYMTRIGFTPVGQLQVMNVLQSDAASRSEQPEILSTHPLPKTRIRHLEQHIDQHYPDYENPSIYRFNYDSFKSAVLDPLDKLPPPDQPKQSVN